MLLSKLATRLRAAGVDVPATVGTPYVNTIPADNEPPYPGDREIERRIKSYIRWNAMAMVVNANRLHNGLAATSRPIASLCDALRGRASIISSAAATADSPADMVYFQGHADAGHLRARVSRRAAGRTNTCTISARNCAEGGGLSSYPHPYLMPDFWQFPTVSMGLGPIMSIYQARFNRYLQGARLHQRRRRTEGLVLRRRRRDATNRKRSARSRSRRAKISTI